MSNQRYISDTLKKKKKKVQKIRVYIFLSFFVLFIGVLVYLSTLPKFQITTVEVNDLQFVSKDEVNNVIQKELNKKILWLIPRSNIFLFSSKKIEREIMQNPAFISVKINKDFFNTISIIITEQEKHALYCTNESNTLCYFVNPEGMLYSQTQSISDSEILIYVLDKELQNKDFIINTETYKHISNFIKSVKQLDIQIQKMFIFSDGVIEFETNTQTRIRTSIFDNFENNFISFVALFEQNILQKDKMFEIQYIDLRFGNKVFYKNKTN
jgi:cell division septal protein FtsQ